MEETAGGYGPPGTVRIPFSTPEYGHALLKPIPFDMDLARQFMTKASYSY